VAAGRRVCEARERIDSLVMSGRGARQSLKAIIAAAIYGLPVAVQEVIETRVLGLPMLAALSLGVHSENAEPVKPV
jgi:ribulose kinase